jgi:hypothetical protein
LGKQLSHHVVNFSERTLVLIDFISNALTKIKQVEQDAKNSILSLSIIAMGIARAVCCYDRITSSLTRHATRLIYAFIQNQRKSRPDS